MKELQQKIDELETMIVEAVGVLQSIKKQNSILTEENQRLTYNINPLSNDRGVLSTTKVEAGSSEKEVLSDRDINIELIREELDSCIRELESYIETKKR